EATARALMMAKLHGTIAYIVHMTCRESAEALERAKLAGQKCYGETCPQYLLLDDTVFAKPDFEGAAYVMSPPIRPPHMGHHDALWNGLVVVPHVGHRDARVPGRVVVPHVGRTDGRAHHVGGALEVGLREHGVVEQQVLRAGQLHADPERRGGDRG